MYIYFTCFFVLFFFIVFRSLSTYAQDRVVHTCVLKLKRSCIYVYIHIYIYVCFSIMHTRHNCTCFVYLYYPPVPPTTHTYETCACEISHGTRASITYILYILYTCDKCYWRHFCRGDARAHVYAFG